MSGSIFPVDQILSLLAALVGLGGLLGIGEGVRVLGASPRTTRRVVHLGAALFVVFTPCLFRTPVPVYILAGVFVVLNTGARLWGWWPAIHRARPESWGTVAMPLAVFPALAVTWSVGVDRIFIFQSAFLVLALADPVAGEMGRVWGRRELMKGATWVGSSVFFVLTTFLVGTVVALGPNWSIRRGVEAAIVTGLVATGVEALSGHGWDNLFVVCAVVATLAGLEGIPGAEVFLPVGLAIGMGVAGIAYWSQALDKPGAVGAGLFAASLVGLGGWEWAVPGFTFFVLSSALSWLPGGGEGTDQRPQRSLRQVLANGGVAWGLLLLCVLLPPGSSTLHTLSYLGFVGALATAAADTWATEIGVRFAGSPRSLRTLQPVPSGTSGAVSLLGSCAGLLGAASVVGAALVTGRPDGAAWLKAVGILTAGVIGMGADSVIGATLQVQYWDPNTGKFTEHPVAHASLARGWRGIDNEVVNLVGTGTGAAAAIVLAGSF